MGNINLIKISRDFFKITDEKISNIVWYFLLHIFLDGTILLPPIATAKIIGIVTSGGSMSDVLFWAMMFLVFYLIYFIARIIVWRMYEHMAKIYHLLLQRKILERITNNEGILEKMPSGKLIATFTDDIRWVVDVPDCMCMSVSKVIKIIAIFIIFACNNIIVALIALFIEAIYLALMFKNTKGFARHFDGSRKYEDHIVGIASQTIDGAHQIQTLGLLPSVLKEFNQFGKRWENHYVKRRRYREKLYVIDAWVSYIGKIILYAFMAYLVLNGQLKIEIMVLLISYFEDVIKGTEELRDAVLPLSSYGVQLERIEKILSYSKDKEILSGELDNDYINGRVEFKNVTLTRKQQKILNNISFKALPNQITAITGPKGAGKTSIADLLLRTKKASRGTILIDNESIYDYNKKVYNSNVTGIFSKPFIMNMSIYNNLALTEKNRKKQEEICKRIGLDEIIKKLPYGYNTIISQKDSVLTEGEKHLVSIARALLTNAEILIFDEVSNSGVQAVPNLKDIIKDLRRDHTVIVISNEDELVKIADKVIELNSGKIVN